MEALAEQLIATYLTRGGQVFIAPQYGISAATGGEWACPDILALDFERQEVVVVEVATGAGFGTLEKRLRERQTRWFDPVRAKLSQDGLSLQASWPIRFLGFVRKANLDLAMKAFPNEREVTFAAIEDVSFPWAYWETRQTNGIPR